MITFQTLALLLNIGITLAVGIEAFRRRGTAGARALITLCGLVSLWTAAYLIHEDARLSAWRAYAALASLLLALLATTAVFWLILVRTNRRRWINRGSVALFAVMPVLMVAAFGLVPNRDGLLQLHKETPLVQLFTAGLWERFTAVYVFAMLVAGEGLLLAALLQRRPFVSSLGLAFVGAALPLPVLLMEFAGRSPFARLEVLPFAFGLCGVAFLYGLFEKRPEEIGAIDRHAAVEGMDEGWIVVDVNDTIVDMNPAAERMTGKLREEANGQPISSLLGDLSNVGLTLNTSQEVEMRRSFHLEEGWRYLNIRISTLMDRERTPFGRLTLWRDMTDRKRTEDSRHRAKDEMFVLMNAISSAASNTLSTQEFLLDSIYHIITPFRSQVVGVFLLEEKPKRREGVRLKLASHFGLAAEASEELAHVPADSPLFHSVINNRNPMQLTEAELDERVPGPMRSIPLDSVLVLPLIPQGDENDKFLGCMVLGRKEAPSFSQDEIVRLTAIADHIASLLNSDRRRKLAIAMNERQRLIRDLHDSVSNKLYGLVTTTEAAQAAMEAGSNVDPLQEFAKIGEQARQAVKEMRLFLFQMHQVNIEQEGLVAVLLQRLSAVEGRANVKTRLLADEGELPLAVDSQLALYYLAQEALNNSLRHAHAKSVLVTLKHGRGNVVLEILDDGVGFDPKKVDRAGLGLRNMKERAAQLNGRLQVISKPNVGTRIVATVPAEPGTK